LNVQQLVVVHIPYPVRVAGTRWLTADEQQAWRAYLEATYLLFDALDRQLQRDAGIPHGYYEILVRLSEEPDRSMRMSKLADLTRASRSRLSLAVARLEERGWVERVDCATDRRGQLAHLTDAGFAALEDAAPGHVETVHTHFVDPLTAEQLRHLADIGSAMIASLEERAASRGPDRE
jgi:DNA-binding MarR family transcriptional regulator